VPGSPILGRDPATSGSGYGGLSLIEALDVRLRSVRLEDPSRARQVLLRVVERDPHADPIPWAGPQAGSICRPLQPGVWETGDPVTVTLAHQHTLLVGATGSGKVDAAQYRGRRAGRCPRRRLLGG